MPNLAVPITLRSGHSDNTVPHGRLVGVLVRQPRNLVSSDARGAISRKKLSILRRKLHAKRALGVLDLLLSGWTGNFELAEYIVANLQYHRRCLLLPRWCSEPEVIGPVGELYCMQIGVTATSRLGVMNVAFSLSAARLLCLQERPSSRHCCTSQRCHSDVERRSRPPAWAYPQAGSGCCTMRQQSPETSDGLDFSRQFGLLSGPGSTAGLERTHVFRCAAWPRGAWVFRSSHTACRWRLVAAH